MCDTRRCLNIIEMYRWMFRGNVEIPVLSFEIGLLYLFHKNKAFLVTLRWEELKRPNQAKIIKKSDMHVQNK